MKNSMMRFLAGVALALLALPCAAQSYPSKPILAVMPLQAGSAVDVMIRIVAQKMSENMGQQIVIENQPGAAGSIGAERVKRAPPDGYTVGVLNDSILTMIPNIRQVAYDPVKDFVPVGVVAAITWVMVVSNELPAKTVPEFVVPRATPNAIVERLNAEMVKAVNSPEVREKLIAQGLEPVGSPPAMVTQWTQDGLKRMRDIVQRAKIQAE